MDEEAAEEFDIHLPALRVPYDFRPIKIRVYRNGDENDLGKEVIVTRREFKHWIIFLDALTKRLDTTTAVNKLYTIHGERIDHFEDLEWKGEYVAVERAAFILCEYGRYRQDRRDEKKWKTTLHLEETPPVFLNSAETMDIYLKHEGYGSCTGLPYPLDSILAHSPSGSALHLHSHAHAEMGRSLEKLNMVGRPVWNEEQGKDQSKSDVHLPRLVGLDDPQSVETKEKLSSVPTLPPLDGQQKPKEEQDVKRDVTEKEEAPVPARGEKCPAEEILVKVLEGRNEAEKEEKATEHKQEEVEEKEPREHIVIPILVGRSTSNLTKHKPPPPTQSSHHSVHWSNDQSFDADLDDSYCFFPRKKEPPPRKPRGVEKIFERTERHIVRQFSDDEIHPVRDVVSSSANYKTYLWEARAFDPDFD